MKNMDIGKNKVIEFCSYQNKEKVDKKKMKGDYTYTPKRGLHEASFQSPIISKKSRIVSSFFSSSSLKKTKKISGHPSIKESCLASTVLNERRNMLKSETSKNLSPAKFGFNQILPSILEK